MTLDPSALNLFCQNCGASWSRTDEVEYSHFMPQPSGHPDKVESPAAIDSEALQILNCPKCPQPVIDRLMELYYGVPLPEGRDPRKGPPNDDRG